MLIRLLSAQTFRAHCFTYPIRAFAKQISQIGLTVKIHFRPTASLGDCDVLGIVDDYFQRTGTNSSVIVDLLKRYRSQVRGLIYFDVNDSTGMTRFEVLPIVDLYAKKQLLRDRLLYTQRLYGARYYTHYYHELKGIVDKRETWGQTARADELDKIAVSWNIGLGDYRTFNTWGRRLRIFWPWADYRVKANPSSGAGKEIDISYRASSQFARATVSFQREETRRQIKEMAANGEYKIVFQGRIPYHKYRAEMRQTLIVPSPFGWGEICFRDFECFLLGATLLKPDMSHLETWPAYYEPGVTYVPHAWDFSDFQNKVVGLLDSPATCQRVAQAAQDKYLESLSSAGGEAFARHVAALIQKAVGRS